MEFSYNSVRIGFISIKLWDAILVVLFAILCYFIESSILVPLLFTIYVLVYRTNLYYNFKNPKLPTLVLLTFFIPTSLFLDFMDAHFVVIGSAMIVSRYFVNEATRKPVLTKF